MTEQRRRVCGWCGHELAPGAQPPKLSICNICELHHDNLLMLFDTVMSVVVYLVPVVSSNIAAAGWYAHKDSGVMVVRFTSGTVYRYEHVPRAVWLEFLAAPSKGQFFARTLRDARMYPYQQLSAQAEPHA